ncbi:MAG: peptidylprolyl isomerase [Phycisphaerae bacterium]|nr:peptidylprolyl isomerase [Phycisphaerae bacterium]
MNDLRVNLLIVSLAVCALAACKPARPPTPIQKEPPQPKAVSIVDDPLLVRLAAQSSQPDALYNDTATKPPTIRVQGIHDPAKPTARPVETVGTVDDYIAAQVAQRLNLPGLPSATDPTAGASPRVPVEPTTRTVIDDLSGSQGPVAGRPIAPPQPARLVLPGRGDPHPLTGQTVVTMGDIPNPPLPRATSNPDTPPSPGSPKTAGGSTKTPAPPVAHEMAVAPLSGAALTLAGRVFTADEILRPIWGELDRLATRLSPDDHRRQALDLISNQLRSEIAEHLVYQEADRQMTDDVRESVKQTLNDMMRERANTMFEGSERKMRQAWAHDGLDPDKEIEKARRQLLVQAYLREKFMPQIHVVRAEAFAYYEKHMEEFSQEPKIHVKLIQVSPVFPDRGVVTEQDRLAAVNKARDRARQILDQIRSGAMTFEKAADDFSDNRSNNGGDVGLIRKGSLRARRVEEAAFGLAVGKTTDVVEETIDGQASFYIAMVTEAVPLKVIPFADAVNTVVPKLERQKFNEQSAAYMAKLYKQAGIEDQQIFKFLEETYRVVPKPARQE